MKLYYAKGSCSEVVKITAKALGIHLDVVNVDLATGKLDDGSDFAAINPKGYVPALQLDSGEILTEVSAICSYLSSLLDNQTLYPHLGVENARQLEWFNFIATEIHKQYTPKFMKAMGFHNPSEDWINFADQKLSDRYSYLNQWLAENRFLTGDQFTCVDIYLYIVMSWAPFVQFDLSQYGYLIAYQQKVLEKIEPWLS